MAREQAEHFNRDPMNLNYMKHAVLADNLDAAMEFAYRSTKTDKVIIFDGAAGGVNVSRPLADRLRDAASKVNVRVDEVLMPKWLGKRNLEPELLANVA